MWTTNYVQGKPLSTLKSRVVTLEERFLSSKRKLDLACKEEKWFKRFMIRNDSFNDDSVFWTWRHFLVVCKMQCHLVVRKHMLYPRFLFFRFLWVSRTCSDFGVKSWKPWEDAPSGTLWIYVAASSQVEPLAAGIQYEGCLTSNANAAVICFLVTSCPVSSFEFWIMATLDGFAHRAFKFPFSHHICTP